MLPTFGAETAHFINWVLYSPQGGRARELAASLAAANPHRTRLDNRERAKAIDHPSELIGEQRRKLDAEYDQQLARPPETQLAEALEQLFSETVWESLPDAPANRDEGGFEEFNSDEAFTNRDAELSLVLPIFLSAARNICFQSAAFFLLDLAYQHYGPESDGKGDESGPTDQKG